MGPAATDSVLVTDGGPISIPRVDIRIVEQPAPQGPKFRYAVEERVGVILGENSTKDNKTYPTIEITNYVGRAIVVVSCVSVDDRPRPHPHKLIHKKCTFCLNTGLCKNYAISSEHCTDGLCALCKDGRCANCKSTNGICVVTKDITLENRFVDFPNIGIQCVKKREIKNSLTVRQLQGIDPYNSGFDHMSSPQSINLHAVRLCFQLFVIAGQEKLRVVSNTIYNAKKIPVQLELQDLSHSRGSAQGGTRVTLLCEELKPNDVEVVMYTEVRGGREWYQPGQIVKVHMNCAIVFITPPYKDPDVKHFVEAFIKLRSKSSDEVSNSLRFTYVPDDRVPGPDYLEKKLKKKLRPEIEQIANIVSPPGPPVEHNIKWNPYPTWNPSMPSTSRDANYMQPALQVPSPYDMHRPSMNMTSVPATSPDIQEMPIEMLSPACVVSPRQVTPPQHPVLPQHEAMFDYYRLQGHEGLIEDNFANGQGDMLHHNMDANVVQSVDHPMETDSGPSILKQLKRPDGTLDSSEIDLSCSFDSVDSVNEHEQLSEVLSEIPTDDLIK